MKRYIATNANGRAANGTLIEPGKLSKHSAPSRDKMLPQLEICCCPTPESAVLSSPFPPDQCRIFQVECFGADNPDVAYSVIKEIEDVPSPTQFQRLAFAVAVMSRANTGIPQFKNWCDGWLANRDRTTETAHGLRERLERQGTNAREAEPPTGLSAWARELETIDNDMPSADPQWTGRACALLKAVEATELVDRDAQLGRAMLGWGSWQVPSENITRAILSLTS